MGSHVAHSSRQYAWAWPTWNGSSFTNQRVDQTPRNYVLTIYGSQTRSFNSFRTRTLRIQKARYGAGDVDDRGIAELVDWRASSRTAYTAFTDTHNRNTAFYLASQNIETVKDSPANTHYHGRLRNITRKALKFAADSHAEKCIRMNELYCRWF